MRNKVKFTSKNVSRMSVNSDNDSDKDSIESIGAFDTEDLVENGEENTYIQNVREAVKNWKVNKMDETTEANSNVKGLDPLRKYVANSSRLFYDLMSFLSTSKNNEKNMKDNYYVKIVSAIGVPGGLSFHIRTLLEHFLQRDLIELPFTLETNMVNAYAQKGVQVSTNFPDEE